MSKQKNLYARLERAIQSGQPGLWVRSHEQDEAYATIDQMQREREENWVLRSWDVIRGMIGTDIPLTEKTGADALNQESCLSAIRALLDEAEKRADRAEAAGGDLDQIPKADLRNILLVIRNGQREIENNGATNRELIMALMLLLTVGKAQRCHVLLLVPPGTTPPLDLRDALQVIDHELPGQPDRVDIATDILGEEKNVDAERIARIAQICGGLTRGQVERVCAEALVTGTKRLERTARQLKTEIVNSTGFMTLAPGLTKFDPYTIKRGDVDHGHLFESDEHPRTLIRVDKDSFYVPGVGGCQGFKDFTLSLLNNVEGKRIRPSGALLLGVPGVGKSLSAVALGNELGWPVLMFNFGELMGQYVGQSEAQLNAALQIADYMSPCILYAEEINLAFQGSQSGQSDNGVASRMLGALLTWLENHSSLVYFVGSCNDSRTLPPALKRAGRMDVQFFFDYPTPEVREEIWKMFIGGLGLDPHQERPADDMWAGAEIRSCCTTAHLTGWPLVKAAKIVVPTMSSCKEEMNELRRWAEGRCIDAATGDHYQMDGAPVVKNPHRAVRKMHRRTSGRAEE